MNNQIDNNTYVNNLTLPSENEAQVCPPEERGIDKAGTRSGLKDLMIEYGDCYGVELDMDNPPGVDELIRSISKKSKSSTPDWPMPKPLSAFKLPSFPTDCLPAPIRDFVEGLAESTQTPKEMAGVLSLGIMSALYQSKYVVEINNGWHEVLCLYCVAVASSGERKSPVINALKGPLADYEDTRRKAEADSLEKNKIEYSMLEYDLYTAKRARDSSAEKKQRITEAINKLKEFKSQHKLSEYYLLIDDTTPEMLGQLLSEQKDGLTIASSEGGIFDILNGRYNKAPNFDVFLKAHDGESISVHRVSREATHVRNPRLSMVLTIQPVVLEKLMSDKYNRGQGICARILYAMCDFNSLVGHRKAKPDTIAPKVKAEYENFILKSLSSEYSGIIELSPEADELRCEFSEKIEPKFQDEWIDMQDWVQKLAGTAVRIAGLIHAAEAEGDPTQEPVSGEEMRRAITIAEFLSAHAEAAYRNSCPSKTDADAIYLEKRLRENGKEEITKRDLHQMCRGRFKEAEEMDPALQILSEKNYIRMEIIRTGGRPSKKILVNPRILEDKVSEKTSRALTA